MNTEKEIADAMACRDALLTLGKAQAEFRTTSAAYAKARGPALDGCDEDEAWLSSLAAMSAAEGVVRALAGRLTLVTAANEGAKTEAFRACTCAPREGEGPRRRVTIHSPKGKDCGEFFYCEGAIAGDRSRGFRVEAAEGGSR